MHLCTVGAHPTLPMPTTYIRRSPGVTCDTGGGNVLGDSLRSIKEAGIWQRTSACRQPSARQPLY